MQTDILRGELERLFNLDELTALSRDLLGFDPDEIGGTTAKASFARALTDLCAEIEALDALAEAVLASRTEADPRLRKFGVLTPDETLPTGTEIGSASIVRKLGEGGTGIVYEAVRDDDAVIVKVLRKEAIRDRRALHRFFTVNRLVARVTHDSLPSGLTVGTEGAHHYVMYDFVKAESFATRVARGGAMHLNEARPLFRSILDALAALHERRLAHGNLKLENVLLAQDGSSRVILVDAGGDRLRLRPFTFNGHAELVATLGAPKTTAPEQIRGAAADPRSDVYAFGALAYEVLTGKPVFAVDSSVDAAAAHLTRTPEPPSAVAPRGWVGRDLDNFVLALLNKDPAARLKDARAVMEAIDSLVRTMSIRPPSAITDEEVDSRVYELVAAPEDEAAALRLESAVDDGADPTRVAEAFVLAAEQLAAEGDAFQDEAKKSLLYRAARVYEKSGDQTKAEETYTRISALDPHDDVAITALEQLRRALGKHEDLIELLLARAEASESPSERARAMSQIGRIYAHELEDKQQAVVAYAQAFSEDPGEDDYADQVEKVAGTDTALWGEACAMCAEASSGQIPSDVRNLLLIRLGRWYVEKLSRPDLALPCFQTIANSEPSHREALAGLSSVYQKAQQWPELVQILLHRANAAPTASAARDFKSQAADLLAGRLGDMARARDLYQQIIDEDPSHVGATDALARILENSGDHTGLIRVLEHRADAQRGDDKWATLARIAELYEDQLNDLPEATRRYEAILHLDEQNLDALKGLDRIYNRTGKYHELLSVLQRQIRAAATPRQRISLYERIAAIYEEEFLDHEQAADACEAMLALDGSHDSALSALARHYRALDRWEDVTSTYERHLKVITDDARRIELLLALGRVLADHIGSPERATRAYEQVITIDENHSAALNALAKLREGAGDAGAALEAIETLANQAATPEAKAEQWMRAAKLLESRGDLDGAIEKLKRALDENPTDTSASQALRTAYAARGDASAAVDLIAREVESASGPTQKAILLAEMARLSKDRLRDDDRALSAAMQANRLDPTNVAALVVLGDLAFEEEHFVEAVAHYELPANRVDTMEKGEGARVLVRYVDALSKTGSTEKALVPMDALLKIAPDNADALSRVARVTFEHGEPKRAYELYRELIGRYREKLVLSEEADALYRLGESARRAGHLDYALGPLSEAADMDPSTAEPLAALAKVYESRGEWENVIKTKNRRLDVAHSEERYQLLLDVGEIYGSKLNDRTRAAKTYIAALEDRPDDRNLLTRLMQLYSEEKDWSRLIEVVLKLAEFVDDKKQRAKYLHTAAIVSARQLGEIEQALEYYDQVFDLDPEMDKALEEAITLRNQKGDFQGVERLLKLKLDRANESGDQEMMLDSFEKLAVLYHKRLGWIGEAIDAYEAAQTLDPENRQRNELLASLYTSDPVQYLDKAVNAHRAILRKNPNKRDSYKLLRRLYTEAKRADAAWCFCQALYLLNLAEPDEERFFKRMRSDSPAPAQHQLNDDDWAKYMLHEDADPIVTAVFVVIEPAILGARARSLVNLGYDPSYAIDVGAHPSPMAQTLYYAAGVLGGKLPPTFENPNDMGGMQFLHAHTPSIVLGRAALGADIPPQTAAFIVGRHITYYRRGMYVRNLVPTGTGLKAWLFAAIKLIAPQFPIPPELEGPVKESLTALSVAITGPVRERLASLVGKLLSGGGSLDLKRWMMAIDLTADRAGLVLAHDLEVAGEIIKASPEDANTVSTKDRLKELVLFAVSEEYFALRTRLGVAIDS